MNESTNKNTNETAHDAIYWQTYQQVLDEGHDVRVARAEATNVEKRARAEARTAARIRARAEQNGNKGQAPKAAGKQARSKQAPTSKADAMRGKGTDASSRLKLFADVREGKTPQLDVGKLQQQVRQQPLHQRAMPSELTPAQKKYLLAMYQLDSKSVRQKEIADTLGVTKASTHKVIHELIELGLVNCDEQCRLAFSEQGFIAAISFYDCYNAIAEDLLRDLPLEKFHQKKQATLEAVLKMPQELVQEILQSRASEKNFLTEGQCLSANE